jgi:superfamily I DNA and/or RNA helicase
MQGKEADVVILVLGTDSSAAGKARDWVGTAPNLLNVAVSRAKRRLYVIGGYAEWHAAPGFGVFAEVTGFPTYPFG